MENRAMPGEETSSPRTGKKLFDATRPFAKESRIKSWWYVGSALFLLVVMLVLAATAPWWPVRLCASVLGGLLFVRVFITFHDFTHGSLLRGSRLASTLFSFYGLVVLTPPRYWRQSHN